MSGVSNDELFVLGPFPLAREGSSTQAGRGLEITIRRSVSGDAQVFDVVAPDDLAAGTYAGIIYSADGADHGHISIKLHD